MFVVVDLDVDVGGERVGYLRAVFVVVAAAFDTDAAFEAAFEEAFPIAMLTM